MLADLVGSASRAEAASESLFRVVDDAAILERVTITTASLLSSLETVAFEMTKMLAVLDGANADAVTPIDRRELKRRVIDLREKVQELLEELSVAS